MAVRTPRRVKRYLRTNDRMSARHLRLAGRWCRRQDQAFGQFLADVLMSNYPTDVPTDDEVSEAPDDRD
jgi:hypothetical protein